LQNRTQTLGGKAKDFALLHFLNLLISLRRIILQDAAILQAKYPNLSIWQYEPFNTSTFVSFSCSAQDTVARAEADVRGMIGELPEAYAQSLRGVLTTVSIKSSQEQEMYRQSCDALHARVGIMQTAVVSALGGSKAKRQKMEKLLAESTGMHC